MDARSWLSFLGKAEWRPPRTRILLDLGDTHLPVTGECVKSKYTKNDTIALRYNKLQWPCGVFYITCNMCFIYHRLVSLIK